MLPSETVLRAGATSAREDAAKHFDAAGRPDAPAARDPALQPQANEKALDRRGDVEARKLMLEDGMRERDAPPRQEPDLGDLEL